MKFVRNKKEAILSFPFVDSVDIVYKIQMQMLVNTSSYQLLSQVVSILRKWTFKGIQSQLLRYNVFQACFFLLFFFQKGKCCDTLFFKDGKRRIGKCSTHMYVMYLQNAVLLKNNAYCVWNFQIGSVFVSFSFSIHC